MLLTGTIEPSGVTLQHVLSAYRHAIGTVAPGRGATRILHWSVTIGAETGTRTDIESGNDNRIDTVLGPMHDAEGVLGGQYWSMNENGEVVSAQHIHRAEELDDAAFNAATGLSPDVTLTGYTTQPYDAYVVKVNPPGGALEDYYIDRRTSLLDAREIQLHGHTTLVTYDDYRVTLGLPFAWHVHVSIDNDRETEDFRLEDMQSGEPIDPSSIAIPQSACIVSFGAPRVTLPAKIIDDEIVVATQIGGRSVNLLLDSGSAGIAIDRGIIEALGYQEYGKVMSETAGVYAESDAVVGSMAIGTLSMQNVAVKSIPIGMLADEKTPVGGLLGFDFIDCTVLHIDYVNGTVEAIDPQSFTPPPGSISVPIILDDEIPAIEAAIGPASNLRFLVDTGAGRSVLFSTFPTAHPEAIADKGLGAEFEAAFPFFNSFEGVGGDVKFRPVQVGPLTVAQWTFPRWVFDLTQDPSKFEIQDYDGILGQDLLRYYDLYLDYPHGRILFVPNSRYEDRFGG